MTTLLKTFNHHGRLPVLFVLSCTLIVAFYFIYNASVIHLQPIYFSDQLGYITGARHIADYGHFILHGHFPGTGSTVLPGMGHTPYARIYMPGYYLILAAFYKLFGFCALSTIGPNIVSYLLSVILVYVISAKIYDHKAANLATLLFILLPMNLSYSMTALIEPTYTLVCLSAFTLFIFLPNKSRLAAIPILLGLLYLFRQTSLALLFPMIAYAYDTQSIKKHWQTLLVIIITFVTVSQLNTWQVHLGLAHIPLQDVLVRGHTNYANAFSNSEAPTLNLINIFGLLIQHTWTNITIFFHNIMHPNDISLFWESHLYSLLLLFITTTRYGIVKRNQTLLPIAVSLMFCSVATLCFTLQYAHPWLLNRLSMFCLPLICMVFAKALTDETLGDYRFFNYLQRHINFILIAVFALFIASNLNVAYELTLREKISSENTHFIETIKPDPTKLIISDHHLFLQYLLYHYPDLGGFIPQNDQTLKLTNQNFEIGTIIISPNDLDKMITKNGIHSIGLHHTDTKTLRGEKYLIFRR